MGFPAKKSTDVKYTWRDYLTWPDDERWEVIDGEAYNMTPSPSFRHQIITGNFYALIKEKLKGGQCIVAIAPLDVYFDDYNFVQPDVLVVCDKEKIKDRVYGSPDLIIEVLSPYTSIKDKREKKKLYERFGVKEYILAYPEELHIERFLLHEGKYHEPDIFGAEESFRIGIFEDMEIPLWEVFEIEKPGSGNN